MRLTGPLPPVRTTARHPAPRLQTDLAAESIRIPELNVTATIAPARLDNGVLTPPRQSDVVGIWSGSAALGAVSGETTIAGHVNWRGMRAFTFGRLAYLHRGDLVYTTDATGQQASWRVVSVSARRKARGIDPAAFAGAAGPRRLALITCGGTYDAGEGSYEDNVYVLAEPVA